jgi:hypothetical protein
MTRHTASITEIKVIINHKIFFNADTGTPKTQTQVLWRLLKKNSSYFNHQIGIVF